MARCRGQLATYWGLAKSGELNSHVAALPVIEFKKGHPEQQLATALQWRERFKTVPGVKIAVSRSLPMESLNTPPRQRFSPSHIGLPEEMAICCSIRQNLPGSRSPRTSRE